MRPFAPLTRVDLMSLHLPSLPLSHTIILTRCPLLRPFLHLRVLHGPAQVPCLSPALPDKPSLGSFLLSPCSFSRRHTFIQKNPNNIEENRSSLGNIPGDHLLSLTTGRLPESLGLIPSAKGEAHGRDCVFTHLYLFHSTRLCPMCDLINISWCEETVSHTMFRGKMLHSLRELWFSHARLERKNSPELSFRSVPPMKIRL